MQWVSITNIGITIFGEIDVDTCNLTATFIKTNLTLHLPIIFFSCTLYIISFPKRHKSLSITNESNKLWECAFPMLFNGQFSQIALLFNKMLLSHKLAIIINYVCSKILYNRVIHRIKSSHINSTSEKKFVIDEREILVTWWQGDELQHSVTITESKS